MKNWTIIYNESHTLRRFATRRQLREELSRLRQLGYTPRRSPLDERTYYTESYQHIPS